MIKASKFSFGGTAAIVTNMALIIGLNAATATRSAIVSGLLIVALSIVIARQRLVSAVSEIGKHLAAAGAVLFLSRTIGVWIPAHFH